MGKIKVLHIITRLIVGGAQENTMYTAELLDKTRYQIDVVSGPQSGSEGSLISEFQARGIRLTILPYLVREINPIYDLIVLFKLYKLIKYNKFTIVHTHSSKAGILGRISARLAGKSLIVHTVHGWSYHTFMHRCIRIIYTFLERLTAHFTDALIVVSERDREKGLNSKIAYSGKYHLIRSAISQTDFNIASPDKNAMRIELGIPTDAPLLGTVGRFTDQKNPLEWVKVATIVKQSVPDCYFLMVGDGPLHNQVTSLLRDSGLLEYTIMTGIRRDIPRLLSGMDVFLLTSLWEGLPRVIPEAILSGVPVVASNVDGSAEIIQNGVTGYLCTPNDSQSFAECCIELLTNPDKRKKMTEAAKILVSQDFDLNKMITQIDQLYLKLVDHHGKKQND